MTDKAVVVWVLWHRYGDGSGAHIERAYLDGLRARQDHELLAKAPGGGEWHLDEVPLFGSQA
jgi:hypothetical protein